MNAAVDDLGERPLPVAAAEKDTPPSPVAPPPTAPGRIVCLPAHDRADELAGRMLCQLLTATGIDASFISSESFSGEAIADIAKLEPAVVCLSCLPPGAILHARYMCKRVRARFPDMPIVVGVWIQSTEPQAALQRLQAMPNVRVVTTLPQAVDQIRALAALAPARVDSKV